MSRLFVKGLPKHVDERRLREHFAAKGNVTDVKIMKTKSGRSRQFGFVGFGTDAEAKAARKHFHQTFMDTSRLEVTVAKPIGDGQLDRPWSKHSEGSSAFRKRQREVDEESTKSKRQKTEQKEASREEKDEKLAQFLQLSTKKGKFWADDSSIAQLPGSANSKLKQKDGSDDEKEVVTVSQLVRSKKAGGENTFYEKKHTLFVDSDDEGDQEADSSDDEYQDLADVGVSTVAEEDSEEEDAEDVVFDDSVSDLDYLRSRMKKNDKEKDGDEGEDSEKDSDEASSAKDDESSDDSDDESSDEGSDDESDDESDEEEDSDDDSGTVGTKKQPEEVALEDSGRLYVRNLAYTCTEDELRGLFSKYGELSDINLPVDTVSLRCKGFAFITYVHPANAISALSALEGSIFCGRILHVMPAKGHVQGTHGNDRLSVKNKLEQTKKDRADDSDAWNALFLRSDTVADAMASKLDVTKSDFLDPTSANLASRMTLAETSVIQETKEYLQDHGVDLSILSHLSAGKIVRSKTAMLVKNLPHATEEDELKTLFGEYGTILRAIAMIEFGDVDSARKAYRALSYTPFKQVPLFLEWLPEKVFLKAAKPVVEKKKKKKEKEATTKEGSPATASNIESAMGLDVEQADSTNTATLYVKNLNFDTTEDGLMRLFSKMGSVRSARVATRKDMSKGGAVLSLGYGFVEFERKEDAIKAIKRLQGKKLDNHVLELKFSEKRQAPKKETKRHERARTEERSNKLLVKNLAFEATRQDLQYLFTSFGTVKSIRIPKKFDGKSRGFAFVEMGSMREAKEALEQLKHSHLYGRHLVLEFAKVHKTKGV